MDNTLTKTVDFKESNQDPWVIIHWTPHILFVSSDHTWIRQKNKCKGANKEVRKWGQEVIFCQSVHQHSNILPSLFARQHLGHTLSTTIPS